MEAGGRWFRVASVTGYCLYSRETRLLSDETEVNGDSKSTNEMGSCLDWFIGLFVPVQEIFDVVLF
jgi:hypothetical protein